MGHLQSTGRSFYTVPSQSSNVGHVTKPLISKVSRDVAKKKFVLFQRQINPWTGREVALEEAEKEKQMELGTKDELFAVDLVRFVRNKIKKCWNGPKGRASG